MLGYRKSSPRCLGDDRTCAVVNARKLLLMRECSTANSVFAMECFVSRNSRVRPGASHSMASASILCVVLIFPSIRDFNDERNAVTPTRGSGATVLLHSGGSAAGPARKGTPEGN